MYSFGIFVAELIFKQSPPPKMQRRMNRPQGSGAEIDDNPRKGCGE
jgi:hypothetical protein